MEEAVSSAGAIVNRVARVLLVDDYPDALESWSLFLRVSGYEVEEACDGPSALQMTQSFDPDLIVLDLDLPGITGIEVARRLRAAPETSHLPLIAVTGYSSTAALERAHQVGFDVVLVKPCEPDHLVFEISRLLDPSLRPPSDGWPPSTI
jgi:two-component system CheB/CheR fusion protein